MVKIFSATAEIIASYRDLRLMLLEYGVSKENLDRVVSASNIPMEILGNLASRVSDQFKKFGYAEKGLGDNECIYPVIPNTQFESHSYDGILGSLSGLVVLGKHQNGRLIDVAYTEIHVPDGRLTDAIRELYRRYCPKFQEIEESLARDPRHKPHLMV